MWEVYFSTSQKLLIKTGIAVFYSSYKLTGLFDLHKDYLHNCEQRVVLNGQTPYWRKINTEVPQGSVLGPLLFLIFINGLPDGVTSICKVFSSLSSKFNDIDISAKKLISDLEKSRKWKFRYKMPFNPDPNHDANELLEISCFQKSDIKNIFITNIWALLLIPS